MALLSARLELAHDVDLAKGVAHVAGALRCRHEPPGGAHGEDLHHREAIAGKLRLEGPAHHALGAGDRPRVLDRAARHVGRAFEPGQEIADDDRVAVVAGVAALEAGLRALAEDAGRRHLATCLAEHAVVQEYARHVLASRRRVKHLLEALVHHVAVPLEREHGRGRPHALDAGGDRRGPAVQGLHYVDVKGAGERRIAPDADHADRGLAQPELGDGFEEDPYRHRFATSRAQVVFACLQQRRRLLADGVHGGLVGGHAGTPWWAMASWMRAAMTSTSSRAPT